MSDILIVEDETVLARSMVSFLERRGFSAVYAVDAASARTLAERERPRLAILDYKLNDDDGLDLLAWMRAADPRVQVVMMTGHGDVAVAVEAMKRGARDFLVKPTPLAAIASIARELMLDEFQGGLDRTGAERIVGRSSAANALRTSVRKLGRPAPNGARAGVLVVGPQGAGKTLAATALHEEGAPDSPLVVLDCALAVGDIGDAVARAGRGTLLLRHVAALRTEEQAALLGALEAAEHPPALIATTTGHLTPGPEFLPGLLYRIQVGWIDIPPLVDRAADVLPIADILARRIARDRGEARPRFSAAARARLVEHDWPGNVAELANCIGRAMLLQSDGTIEADHVRLIGRGPGDEDGMPTLHALEVSAITRALSRTGGNVSRAAELLGISRDTLRYRMEKFEVPRH